MCVGDTELRPTAGSCVRLCKRHLQHHAGPGKPTCFKYTTTDVSTFCIMSYNTNPLML